MDQEKEKQNIVAYIDGANLHKGVKDLGWELDYARFRVWLKEKFKIQKAYLFLGLVSKYKDMYEALQEAGYILVFKETTLGDGGKIKGNCDADFYEGSLDGVVLISSDGDYAGLVAFWKEKKIFRSLISPGDKCSFLLRKQNIPIIYLSTQKSNLEKVAVKEKAPDADETA